MPVLNEADTLRDAVVAVLNQDYPGEQELILALGPSTDSTNEIATELAQQDARITLVHNPERDIPIALNLAVANSRYPIIIRVDAHSQLSSEYTRIAVRTLEQTEAANVGGVMRAEGATPVQRAIANAYNSPIGLGGGTYHATGEAGPAESAYLGVFLRGAFDAVGGFHPRIRRGEDWEFNLRLRRAGHLVWFTPALQVTYWPRESFTQLAQQFFATGRWRAALVRMYGAENPWRFFVPGAYVLSVAIALVMSLLWLLGVFPTGSWWPTLFLLSPVAHLALTSIGGFRASRGLREGALTTIALITMHLTWGAGFLAGLVLGSAKTVDRSRV